MDIHGIYRLAIEAKKVTSSPAKLIRSKKEDNGRIRYLNEYKPLKTRVDYLKQHATEEAPLRTVIGTKYSDHLPEFDIALHTGMRPSEQYALSWDRVNLSRRQVTILKSKNGKVRHIPLNANALVAFRSLPQATSGPVFASKGYKHWFEPAVEEAGIGHNFTWYCLRHTFASRLVMSRVDIRTVAELMGHQTIQMAMRYAHLAPEHNLEAVERLSSFVQPGALPRAKQHGNQSATKSATK